jgi:uncharacterized membrane protein
MRLFGHPVHPVLVSFPVALLGLTSVLDVLGWAGVMAGMTADARSAAWFCQLAGLVVGGLAVVSGFADFMKIPTAARAAVTTALVHGGLALGLLSLHGLAFALRGGRAAAPGPAVLALEIAGALCLAATGWFGGHLVFHHGIGVREPPRSESAPPR